MAEICSKNFYLKNYIQSQYVNSILKCHSVWHYYYFNILNFFLLLQ